MSRNIDHTDDVRRCKHQRIREEKEREKERKKERKKTIKNS